MKREAWFRRLGEQCPGWYVWWASGTAVWASGYWAAPVKTKDGISGGMHGHPHKIGPYRRPQDLRGAMKLRYGAGEHCDTCGAPWEQCGHRQPEQGSESRG